MDFNRMNMELQFGYLLSDIHALYIKLKELLALYE